MYKVFRGGVIRQSDGLYIDNTNHTGWAEYNNWLNQGNMPLPPDPIPEPTVTLEDVRDNKIQLLQQLSARLNGRLMAGLDHNRIPWLTLQREDATGPGSPAPGTYIAEIARHAGISPAQVKTIINEYFSSKLPLQAQLEGNYLKHLIALRTLTTKQEIRDYDINTGWPDIPLKRISER